MPRNYTQLTIKTLFGEASRCAHPDCTEPLVFIERGQSTVVAEIAHIRSEVPGGPRHDASYTGDIDGPANLLLLCGKHHHAVDRHESAYTVQEMEGWKLAQRASAGLGTTLTEVDLRAYQRLSDQEQESLRIVARRAQRVTDTCWKAHERIAAVRDAADQARLDLSAALGFAYAVDEHGAKVPIQTRLPWIDQQRWNQKVDETWAEDRPEAQEALAALHEEIAVLRMSAATLAGAAEQVYQAAAAVMTNVGDAGGLRQADATGQAAVISLWRTAHGEITP